LIEQAIVE